MFVSPLSRLKSRRRSGLWACALLLLFLFLPPADFSYEKQLWGASDLYLFSAETTPDLSIQTCRTFSWQAETIFDCFFVNPPDREAACACTLSPYTYPELPRLPLGAPSACPGLPRPPPA